MKPVTEENAVDKKYINFVEECKVLFQTTFEVKIIDLVFTVMHTKRIK